MVRNNCAEGARKFEKMQLDVGMELTFRLVNVIYKCICTDKHKDPCTNSYTLQDITQNILTSQFLECSSYSFAYCPDKVVFGDGVSTVIHVLLKI